MPLISNGIEKVRVFELPLGIRADGEGIGLPRLALVQWHSSWNDKFYQVYVNSRYAGTTLDADQRQMVVQVPTSSETAVRIEVFAVETSEADIDFSEQLDLPTGQQGRVKITFLRGQNLPIEGIAWVYYDGGSGEMNYDTPLNKSPIKIWPTWQDKAGFGMSKFGASDFGYDSAATAGFGRGGFGNVQFGFDDDVLEWMSPLLQDGVYKFAVKITDESGNQSIASETGEIVVIPAVKPAEQLSISSFNKQTNQLVLSIA